ncbi:putative nicotinate-nucleotide adenylyltransferase [Dirofilaria immitis]
MLLISNFIKLYHNITSILFAMAALQKSHSVSETSEDMTEKLQTSLHNFIIPVKCYSPMTTENDNNDYDPPFEAFVWDWPFSEDCVARGFFSEEKFFVCLPFNQGGTGESRGTLKKFEKISESDFSCIIGLCNNSFFGTYFWRLEIEIMRNLNTLVLNASRDVSRPGETVKRLKRIRKVYKLPEHCDISTLTTASYDWAVTIQALKVMLDDNSKEINMVDILSGGMCKKCHVRAITLMLSTDNRSEKIGICCRIDNDERRIYEWVTSHIKLP